MAYPQQQQRNTPPVRQQPQQQQQYYEQGPPQQQDGYDDRYEQQPYNQGHQRYENEQWDNGQYDRGQQRFQGDRGHVGQSPQIQYASEQYYDEDKGQQRQQPQPPPGQAMGRGPGSYRGPPRGRGGMRPPGMDRSVFNPFPTFPAQRAQQAAPNDEITEGMSQMNINNGGPRRGGLMDPSGRGRGMPPPNRGRGQMRSDPNYRQDPRQFRGQGQSYQGPPRRPIPGRRGGPMNVNISGQGYPNRASDPASPSQQEYGPGGMQRSMTTPQNFTAGPRGGQYNQRHSDDNSVTYGYNDNASYAQAIPRPSTAGGQRPSLPQGAHPPVPQQAPQQQQYQSQHEDAANMDSFYDDYYAGNGERKGSIASALDMPNFDAMPEQNNKHRRGDSIEVHLTGNAQEPYGGAQRFSNADSAVSQNALIQQFTSPGQPRPQSHEQYDRSHYSNDDPRPGPAMVRANTGLAGPSGLPFGLRARGPPPRGMTVDGSQGHYQQHTMDEYSEADHGYGQQPQMQRLYSDQSTYSEPLPYQYRNFSSPVSGGPIQRPGTAGPEQGRLAYDSVGQRPGTAQPLSNPDGLPAHPTPVRAGLMYQDQQQQGYAQQNTRPPPVRQYDYNASQISEDGQSTAPQQPSSAPHPVTHDELNRLRNTWKANPGDNATGLLLAKKLVEAGSVLADEGGTADARTKNKNKEKFNSEAYKTAKKLVSNGDAKAMFFLADCYGSGQMGLQPDTKEAFALYHSAAKAGHAASAYRTAVCCEMGHEEGGGTKKDALKAVQWYRRAAALGDTPALYKMGMILLKGLLGQQRNLGEALNMLKRAADQADRDNPHALHELALIYESTSGNERIIRDEAYSLQLFHQASNLGYKFSQFRLGQAYEYGLLGCPIDPRTSIAWYTKAAAQEEHQSELALSGWYLTGIQGVLEQSDTEAYLWARKAAFVEPPLAKALFAMGYFTEVGIGCSRSLDEAKRWYGRAAAYKFPKAVERLEELKRGGSKAQLKRERIDRTDRKKQDENCVTM